MKSLGVANLRSLHSTGLIEFKPLTVLVGANSSGKSTFLRTLPLLRQSLETKTTGPILWYGNYVDFGSFQSSVGTSEEKEILIEYSADLNSEITNDRSEVYGFRRTKLGFVDSSHVVTKVWLREGRADRTVVSQFEFVLFGDRLRVTADLDGNLTGISFNSREIETDPSVHKLYAGTGLLPDFLVRSDNQVLRLRSKFRWDEVMRLGRSMFHGRTRADTISGVLSRAKLGSPSEMLSQMREITGPSSWKQSLRHCNVRSSRFQKLREALIVSELPRIIDSSNRELAGFLQGSRYIAPVRGAYERFYRGQELAVDEVDPYGTNLAMFLKAMSSRQRSKFQQWLGDNFGFEVELQTAGGHVSIRVRMEGADHSYNMADMGFGFSQIIPVLAQVWDGTTRNRLSQRIGPKIRTFSIEQPELHLHPLMQGRVIDMFSKLVSKARDDMHIQVFLETHSETMINRLGSLVQEGQISENDVQVIVFEKNDEQGTSTARVSEFDSNGFLQNWPFGFFSPGPVFE